MNESEKSIAVKHNTVNLERVRENFFRKVDKNGPIPECCPHLGRCWNWKGRLNPTGYAGMSVAAWNEQRASRISWRIHFGTIPDGIYVLHKCDSRFCTNPNHLYLGDQSQNMKDMFDRKRVRRDGENNGRAKLKMSDIPIILQLLYLKIPQAQIARYYGVWPSTIAYIKRGETWKISP